MNATSQGPYGVQWAGTEPEPFRFVAACDMPVKPIAWLVDGYVEEDAIAVLYGPPGKGKSFIALDLSCCIATGTPFHGHDVNPGAVFYIAGEGHNGLARRLRAWAQHNKTDMPALLFVSEKAAELCSATKAAGVVEAVRQLAEATGEKPALIVIDTLARNFGGDENSATDMGRLIRAADALRQQWGATVLIVHHSGKDGEKGARGSSALRGAVDAEYEVSRSDDDKLIRLKSRKMKDADEPPPLAFELVGVPVRDDAGNIASCAALMLAEYTEPVPVDAKLGKQQRLCLDVLERRHVEYAARLARQGREGHPVYIPVDVWRSDCVEAGVSRQRFHDVKSTLAERDLIRIDGPDVLLVRPVCSPIKEPDRTDRRARILGRAEEGRAKAGHKPDGLPRPPTSRSSDIWPPWTTYAGPA